MGVLGYEPLESQLEEGCAEMEHAHTSAHPVGFVASIEPGSVAERAGFQRGDQILSVNGKQIRDPIDLLFYASESKIAVRYQPADSTGGTSNARGKTLRKILSRRPGEEFGIVLEDFKIKTCNNQCVFCFIHQNPPGLRKGIYFKDGDFRMSFLHGNYITTTNMKEEDFQRIIEQKLSPLYVSVHTTNHELRLRMLGVKRSNNILENLERFARAGIQFHAQIVLCPGWNDGKELDRTIRDLFRFTPQLLSIAIVPLGLTDHRESLPRMEPVTPTFCKQVIHQVSNIQQTLKAKSAKQILFLADEFYVTADAPPPDYADCDVVHQLENGVGMVWEFLRPWRSAVRRLPEKMDAPRRVAILTGLLGARVLRRVVDRLNRIAGLRVEIIPCLNTLFGRSITVSGLLPGRDFLRAIAENPGFDCYLIPGNAVRAEGQVFLDDVTFDALNRSARGRAVALEGDCRDLIEGVVGTKEQ